MTKCGNELLRAPGVVGIIGFAPAGQPHFGGMVEVIIPQAIQSAAPCGHWRNESHLPRLVFGD